MDTLKELLEGSTKPFSKGDVKRLTALRQKLLKDIKTASPEEKEELESEIDDLNQQISSIKSSSLKEDIVPRMSRTLPADREAPARVQLYHSKIQSLLRNINENLNHFIEQDSAHNWSHVGTLSHVYTELRNIDGMLSGNREDI